MILTIDGRDYELKLTTKYLLQLEKKLGHNPINMFIKMAKNEELPSTDELLNVLHFSLKKFQYDMSFDDTIDLFDKYLDDGGSVPALVQVLLDVFIEAGIIKAEENPNVK